MSTLLHPSPSAQGNLVILPLGLEAALLLTYFKYSLHNCPAVVTPREVPWRQGSGLSRLVLISPNCRNVCVPCLTEYINILGKSVIISVVSGPANMVTINLENTKCLIFVIIVSTMFHFTSAQGWIFQNQLPLTLGLYFSSLEQIF